jgi:hypothetical protein
MAQKITLNSQALILEGLLERHPSAKGVVIAHPHPLYGGDMENPVVETIAKSFAKNGYTTLRLNFRGVGKSQGSYDHGKGEQKDILAAIACLENLGISRIDLSGYSFGAWVISQLTDLPASVKDVLLVSPPVAMMAFGSSAAMDRVKAMITGSEDDIAPPSKIRALLQEMKSPAKLDVIPGADHFYGWHAEALESRILSFLT